MKTEDTPTLHVIAGPNGAGKSTLYQNRIQRLFPEAEFVNADLLAKAHYGHNAVTAEESAKGQELAEQRRAQLMAERKSLVTESTFSHESKLDLIREAIKSGYKVNLYHVNVRSADLTVSRVESRVEQGGHPVPENKIRERYVRNQALIHEAAKLADRAYIFDNSALNKPHTLEMELQRGVAIKVGKNVPPWARTLYADELRQYTPQRVNAAAASYDAAKDMVTRQLGDQSATFIGRRGGDYTGPIIGHTEMHTIQQVGNASAVAHFTSALGKELPLGSHAHIQYDTNSRATATVLERGPHAKAADAWRDNPVTAAARYPDHADNMEKANQVMAATRTKLKGQPMDAKSRSRVEGAIQQRLSKDIEFGRPVPDVLLDRRPTPPKDLGRER